MTDDKLADALDNAEDEPGFKILCVPCDGYNDYASGYSIAKWLRSPAGIKLLSEDETIREGIRKVIDRADEEAYWARKELGI